MSKNFTLDDIRTAAEKKFGSTVIEIDSERSVELLNVLRLPKSKRDELQSLSKDDETKGEEQVTKILYLVAKTKGAADLLLKELDGDLAALVTIVEKHMEDTQAGEASPSDD